MILRSLSLQNFRSYTKKSISFSPFTTLIVGKNTAGKTNILEALYVSATGKSFRAEHEKDMIHWGEEIGRSIVETHDDTLELIITSGNVQGVRTPTKKYKVNGVARRMIDFVGKFRVVLFWPEDIELITGSPSKRRRYLDSVLVQVDREYRRNLASYERGLRQRNKLLFFIHEGTASSSQLLYWDHLLIKTGGYITDARTAYIEYLNSKPIPGAKYHVEYDKSIISPERLSQYAQAEVGAKATLVGPHRDDIIFKIHKDTYIGVKKDSIQADTEYSVHWSSLAGFGSRGEQRLGVLWLKLGELSYITEKMNDKPILLLDDIFSELDSVHRDLVMQLIRQQQTIITSAEDESEELANSLGHEPLILHVSK